MLGSKKTKKQDNEPRRKAVESKYSSDGRKVFSYYSSRSQEPETRPRNDVLDQTVKSKNRDLKYIPTLLAIVVVSLAVFYATLINTSNPEIIPLSDNSINILKNKQDYQTSMAKIFNDDFWSKSKLTINTKSLEEKIKQKHPEIEKVSVNIPILGRRPIVQVSPAEPKLIVVTSNGDFVVDINGRILANINDTPEEKTKGLFTIKDSVLKDSKPGDIIFPDSTIKFIDDIKFQFDKKGIDIDYIELPSVANELHVKTKDTNYIIKFNLQGDAREQSGVYFTIAERIAQDNSIQPKEYVDVRVESRAFIK